ncbi:helix-turn-helix domain-containing protein [Macrococcus carouselicus]|uniref:HTH cro/C1-type domain-containing protein n=1 Tax=Macrococcus carouselicus TaxID=69969 RepID=A0A9Q8CJ30_9STAP|nr:type II toxin-antitoxin system MqsA family antitoxin [Macrococcus carouselicus]TDL94375.1 hypothetical protein ERX40_10885 [Macrococcus carouselicus]
MRKYNLSDVIEFKNIPEYSADDIMRIRKNLQLGRNKFAQLTGVSVKTIETWEYGRNRPNGSAARLLQLLESNPDIFMREMINFRIESLK